MRAHAVSMLLALTAVVLFHCAAAAPADRRPLPAPAAVPTVTDSDGDGIADDQDRCPNEPEDCDGFHDEDGCPDPDNDDDGILDVCDHCPNEPENYNGTEDDDGCPDRPRVIIVGDIRIMPHVQFAEGSDRVEVVSIPLIDDIAHTLLANSQIERVLIRGNSSLGERDAQRLSARRASAVHDLLVQRGVAADRLEVRADGTTRPLAPNSTESGRQHNRRIDFEIVQTTPPVPSSPVALPHPAQPPGCPGRQIPPPPASPPPGGCHPRE